METFRLSVRQLVEFALPPDDLIFEKKDYTLLADGTVAHQQRQKNYEEGWEKEVSLKHSLSFPFGDLLITGRMDGYFPDPHCPIVDEIKLLSNSTITLDAPFEVHLAQGLCYAHILCETKGFSQVKVQVSYVDNQGKIRYVFTRHQSAQSLSLAFESYLSLYVRWLSLHLAHRQNRNEALQTLAFPYGQYRPGQRELATQVFTAITQKKRLLASLPTGTGKTAGVLFPALKSLALGHTRQVFYVTARGTGKDSPLQFFSLLSSLPLRIVTLTAKEKICPQSPPLSCDNCPLALGYYTRLSMALADFFALYHWSEETISSLCQKHSICPFECSLALVEVADVVIGDYNYFFDPYARLQRGLARPQDISLLVDEAHHLPSRVRDMLTAILDTKVFYAFRREWGKLHGRKHPLYLQLTQFLRFFQEQPSLIATANSTFKESPEEVPPLWEKLIQISLGTYEILQHFSLLGESFSSPTYEDVLLSLFHFCQIAQKSPQPYVLLLEGSKTYPLFTLFATDISQYVQQLTAPLQGSVFFSATLSPLSATGNLLGFQEEDGLFSLTSPFPPEKLLILRKSIDTRYRAREETAPAVAKTIGETFLVHPGKYIVYFPSFAYLALVYDHLSQQFPQLPFHKQSPAMDEESRETYLQLFTHENEPLLGLCVMGGIFSEGIDLPGDQLIGVMVVGVGLPMVSLKQETLQQSLHQRFGKGFAYAYQYPGMQKVLQAVGRVIRHEQDQGIAVLIDQRYFQQDYISLFPDYWLLEKEPLENFWGTPICPQAPALPPYDVKENNHE